MGEAEAIGGEGGGEGGQMTLPLVQITRAQTPPAKPRFGEPCNGCGLCCAAELCETAEKHFAGAQAPCPALEWDPAWNRARCGLVTNPSRHLRMPFNGDEYLAPLFARSIAAGQGCGMEDDEEDSRL